MAALRPGGMGDRGNDASVFAEFENSMAQAIERALNELLVDEGRDPLSTANTTATRDRRLLFVAIAQGVVNHLVDNADAFRIEDNDGDTLNHHHVVIDRTGP
jgi:hypothetical protein